MELIKRFKKVFISLVCLSLIGTSFVKIYGENKEFEVLNRNQENVSVEYMLENNYITGYQGGNFELEKKISCDEFVNIIVKIFGFDYKEEDEKESLISEYTKYVVNKGWIQEYLIDRNNPAHGNNIITKDRAIKILMNASKIQTYVYEFYNIDEVRKEAFINDKSLNYECKDELMAAYILGLIKVENKSFNNNDGFTRKEVCDLIYKIKENKVNTEKLEPDVLKGLVVDWNEITNDNVKKSVLNYMAYIPRELIERFKEEGWKLVVTGNTMDYVYKGELPNKAERIAGLTDYDLKKVYLRVNNYEDVRRTLIHEFGHFLDRNTVYAEELDNIYIKEKEKLIHLAQREYGGTFSYEFLAEAFVLRTYEMNGVYIGEKEMKKEIPLVYDYLTKLMECDNIL